MVVGVGVHREIKDRTKEINKKIFSSVDVMAWAAAAAVRLCGRQDRHVRNFTLRGGSVV